MPKCAISVSDIRDVIQSYLHCDVYLEAHKSKKKIYQKSGIIQEAYSNIFIVEIEDIDGKQNRLSFSYTDLLTKSVKIIPVNGENEILNQLNED